MEAKELKKLSRSELLEMLLDRSKEVEHLRKELDESKNILQRWSVKLQNPVI